MSKIIYKMLMSLFAMTILISYHGQPIIAATNSPRYPWEYPSVIDLASTYNQYKQAGGTVWDWLSGNKVGTLIGGGGTTRGGGDGRDFQYESKWVCGNGTCVDTSRSIIEIVDIGTGTGRQNIIDPYDKVLNLPAGKVTAIGDGGETRGGGAGRYPISDIDYDAVKNEYTVVTNENITYIVEPQILYTQISYDLSGNTITERYYYNLPDGRNTWDMKESDIYGVPMLYDYTNYKSVAEDDGTEFLFHFDGDIKDASFNNISYIYSSPTYNFSDTGNFSQGLVWNSGNPRITITNPLISTDDYTEEYRIYIPNIQSWIATQNLSTGTLKDTNGTSIADCGNYAERSIFYNGLFGIYSRAYINNKSYGMCDGTGGGTATANNSIAYFAFGNQDSQTIANPIQIPTGGWVTIAIEKLGNILTLYVNGQNVKTHTFVSSLHLTTRRYSGLHGGTNPAQAVPYIIIDEFRLTNRAIYKGNYVPATMPFTTNLVHVLPEDETIKKNGFVAIKSNITVTDVRWGGVKPTYPKLGSTYFSMINTVVESVQQYDGSDWLPVQGAVYNNGEWSELIGFNTKIYTVNNNEYKPPLINPYCKDVVLYELPNGTKDDLNGKDVVFRTYSQLLTKDMIDRYDTTNYSNVDYISIKLDSLPYLKHSSSTDYIATHIYTNFSEPRGFNNETDSIANYHKHYLTSTALRILVPKGTYTSTSDAKDKLAGKQIIYELNKYYSQTDYCKANVVDPTDPVDPPGGIVAALIEALGRIAASLLDLTGDVFGGLVDIFKALFVPTDTAIKGLFDKLDLNFKSKLGFFTAPFDIMSRVLDRFKTDEIETGEPEIDLNHDLPVISIPALIEPFTGQAIIQESTLDFGQILQEQSVNSIYTYYLRFVDVLCFAWVLNLARIKYNSVMKG